ncbi:MAG: molybdenum cofactor guanylyltransferase MobA [Campylobacterota bacterium]|nr:molybdenum cofactor guanylyltransferase MobA [Campylobacterota bacterium]
MIDIPCVIFAGGKSSRMGEDKSLLPFGGFETLTEFQYSRLSKIFSHVYISCKDKNKFDFNANFIEDSNSTQTYAPTVGFIATFETLKSESFFAISVDSPFIGEKTIQELIDNDIPNNDATVAKTESGIQPLCAIYHNSLEHKFQTMQKYGNHKLGLLLKESQTTYVDFEDDSLFLNLNHPHEYQKALQLIDC